MTSHFDCDLLVVGSGAAGLSCAITAKKRGLDVLVIEKEPVFGGTTALSGGVLWIPLNAHGRKQNPQDTLDAVRTYMMQETGTYYDEAAVTAFMDQGPKMVDFFERETEMKFIPTLYPDYHPDVPGGAAIGRSILAQAYDIRGLGKDMPRLKPPLKTITFIGSQAFFPVHEVTDVLFVCGQTPGQSHQGTGAVPTRHQRDQRQCAGSASGQIDAGLGHSHPDLDTGQASFDRERPGGRHAGRRRRW